MIRNLSHSFRLIKIAYVLAREDALFILKELGIALPLASLFSLIKSKKTNTHGARLAQAFEKLGPTFIKLGQTLSTRSDLVGDEIAIELGNLRDNLKAFDFEIAKKTIENELSNSLENIFIEFKKIPVAAASIAQVHRAKTVDGKEVAVKILRPNIEAQFRHDLEFFEWLARRIEANLPKTRRLKPIEVVEIFKKSVWMELDLRFEAAAATEFYENAKETPAFRVPPINWQLTTKRVMVLEWVDGTRINDVATLKAKNINLDSVLKTIAENFLKQVFLDGFFHADMHPGNLFVDDSGNVIAVDFGIMGRLDFETRMYVAEIFRGFLNADFEHVAKAHFKAGYVPKNQNIEQFALACRAIAMPVLDKPLSQISVGKLLGQLFAVTQTFQMETQPQLLLLQKSMVVVEGLGRMLSPDVNMWELAKEPIEKWASETFGLKGRIKNCMEDSAEIFSKFPQVFKNIETALALVSDPSGIKLHPETIDSLKKKTSPA